VIAYDMLLRDGCGVLAELDDRHVVRLESPGQNAAVERALVERGAHLAGDAGELDREALETMERGRIVHPNEWFRGYVDLLAEIDVALVQRGVRWMNHPAEIATMFDKTACHTLLDKAGIATPPRLPPSRNYDALRRAMHEHDVSRVFVKLRYSSSGSGIIALQTAGPSVTARTTVETVTRNGRLRLYNSRRIRCFQDEREIRELVDALCRHDVHVERWLPKATGDGGMFDLRVMLIGGSVRHVVVRQSASPMTNLHLGGRRLDATRLADMIPPAALQRAWSDCERVAAVFPRSFYFGIDLLFTPSFRRHAVLEVNAFGDFLPGIVDGRRETTHEAELATFMAQSTDCGG
jgi:glutathione synthase/RimK-type ligase-like ATP-grasp enzyme